MPQTSPISHSFLPSYIFSVYPSFLNTLIPSYLPSSFLSFIHSYHPLFIASVLPSFLSSLSLYSSLSCILISFPIYYASLLSSSFLSTMLLSDMQVPPPTDGDYSPYQMYLRHVAVRAARLNDQLVALDISGTYVRSLLSSHPIYSVALHIHNF